MKIMFVELRRPRLAVLLATAALSLGSAASAAEAAGEAHDHGDARLGTVEFGVGCSAGIREDFNRAMALYHSFAWSAAADAFAAAAEADPACGMAHWGRAMVMLDNPFVWPGNLPPETLDKVAAALEDARAAGLHDDRERGYVDALEAFVHDHGALDHRARLLAFEEAMGRVAAENPDDLEAAILHALLVSANFDPSDKSYAKQMRAAEILEPLQAAYPDHPGVTHYLIHTFDYPPLAEHGLVAARRYAGIAPDAPHALHMPAHIFTRVGSWQESIDSNIASARADGGASMNTHHAYDYMVYAHLQVGQDQAARAAAEQSLATDPIDNFAAAFAYAAMPARIALEENNWEEASALELTPAADAYPWAKYPHAEAINAFARGVGAARTGDAGAAREERHRLEQLRNATGPDYWIEQVDTQADIVGALSLCADDQTEACLEALQKAAFREDATEKHVVTPGPILPARELLADILLEQDRPDDALVEYEAVLAKEPNRYRAIAGALAAAEQAGDGERARAHAAHLVEQAANADTERASLAQARTIASGE